MRVLVADDEQAIAETLQIILERQGLEVVAVHDGKTAVAKAREWKPDLFLTDVVMPGINGIEAAIQITRFLPECKVLLLSGQAVVHDLMYDARQHGYGFRIMMKPIHPAELIRFVQSTLAEKPEGRQ
jgi:CheY-like chemotaxis protein